MDYNHDSRNSAITFAGYKLDFIKAGHYKFPVPEVWAILTRLDEVGLAPGSIGSSYEELEAILKANGC